MKLHYREVGEGKPFVILHGLFGNSDNWQSHGKRLSDYFRVIMVDLRNHGHSDWSDDFSYDLLVDDLEELVTSMNLKDFILLGHSMGGKAAMKFAQKFPSLLDKLIVVDMGIKAYKPHHQHILEAIKTLDLNAIGSRSEADAHMAKFIEGVAERQFLLKNIYWIEKGKMAWRMNFLVLEREMNEILSEIPNIECFVQSLFIRGANSSYVLDEDIDAIEEVFPDSEFVSIPNAGHWVHAEQPELFLEAVLGFCLR